MKGQLITIEGIDGSGKSTLVELLAEKNTENTIPYYTFLNRWTILEYVKISEKLNEEYINLFSERAINIAWMMDLYENIMKYVLPLLEEGKNVILDRYILSAKAYAIATTKYNMEEFFKIYNLLPKPDICIFLNTDITIAFERIINRQKKMVHYENITDLYKINDVYHQLIRIEPYKIEQIDGNMEKSYVYTKAAKIIETYGREKTNDK